jgi:hypothetical protein
MKKLLVIAALAAMAARAEAQSTFNGYLETRVYDGCIDTRSCHRLTILFGDIAPTQFGSIPISRGMTFFVEHWFNQRGGRAIQIPSIASSAGTTPIGPTTFWEDARYALFCHDWLVASCIGYVRDNNYFDIGAVPVYNGYLPLESYAFFMDYRINADPIAGTPSRYDGTGNTVLTLTSRTITTPEPSTYGMMAAGLAGIVAMGRRRRSART